MEPTTYRSREESHIIVSESVERATLNEDQYIAINCMLGVFSISLFVIARLKSMTDFRQIEYDSHIGFNKSFKMAKIDQRIRALSLFIILAKVLVDFRVFIHILKYEDDLPGISFVKNNLKSIHQIILQFLVNTKHSVANAKRINCQVLYIR